MKKYAFLIAVLLVSSPAQAQRVPPGGGSCPSGCVWSDIVKRCLCWTRDASQNAACSREDKQSAQESLTDNAKAGRLHHS